jgi:hypothetical protein
LHFELDLVNLQLVDKLFQIRRAHPGAAFFCKAFLCPATQAGRLIGFGLAASRGIVLTPAHLDPSFWFPLAPRKAGFAENLAFGTA